MRKTSFREFIRILNVRAKIQSQIHLTESKDSALDSILKIAKQKKGD